MLITNKMINRGKSGLLTNEREQMENPANEAGELRPTDSIEAAQSGIVSEIDGVLEARRLTVGEVQSYTIIL